ncbi:hypothetical protein ACFLSI_01065 [Bacteroidota bacterium]
MTTDKTDFEAQLVDSSRIVADIVTENVGNNPDNYKAVIDLAFSGKEKISRRAGKIIYLVAEQYPELAIPHIPFFLKKLREIQNESIISSILKTFADSILPDNDIDMSKLLNICFDYITGSWKSAGVKVFCLDILFKICQIEPDLKNEVISIIEDQIPKSSSAFQARSIRYLKKLGA